MVVITKMIRVRTPSDEIHYLPVNNGLVLRVIENQVYLEGRTVYVGRGSEDERVVRTQIQANIEVFLRNDQPLLEL